MNSVRAGMTNGTQTEEAPWVYKKHLGPGFSIDPSVMGSGETSIKGEGGGRRVPRPGMG